MTDWGRVGLGVATGGMSEVNNAITGGGVFPKKQDGGGYSSAIDRAKKDLLDRYDKARAGFRGAMLAPQSSAQTGFLRANEAAKKGYGEARGDLESGYNKSEDQLHQGYDEAKAQYETPEMVSSKQELYQRILGKGGMPSDVVGKMKAQTVDDYGTALKEAGRQSQFIGGSMAGGLAGEQAARAVADVGGKRAHDLRDIDIQNEQLRRQEQTGAIDKIAQITAERSGLSEREGNALSDLATRAGEGLGALSSKETDLLTTLAEQEGLTLADIQTKLATGDVELMTRLADALANMSGTQAASNAQIDAANRTSGFFGGGGFLGLGI